MSTIHPPFHFYKFNPNVSIFPPQKPKHDTLVRLSNPKLRTDTHVTTPLHKQLTHEPLLSNKGAATGTLLPCYPHFSHQKSNSASTGTSIKHIPRTDTHGTTPHTRYPMPDTPYPIFPPALTPVLHSGKNTL